MKISEDVLSDVAPHKDWLLGQVSDFFEMENNELIGAVGDDLLKRLSLEKYDDEAEEETSPLCVVFTDSERTSVTIKTGTAKEIWDSIELSFLYSLVKNEHNLSLLWNHFGYYDDYDVAKILADFWHIMDESQRREYIEKSIETYGTPDFLLNIPEYVESLGFESLLQYVRDWSGGGRPEVLKILARDHWNEMNETQKIRWRERAADWTEEVCDDLYMVAIGKPKGQCGCD
jgi:hypothetical protein